VVFALQLLDALGDLAGGDERDLVLVHGVSLGVGVCVLHST
jgi:hypothetical protein